MISKETSCFQGFRLLFILAIAFMHFGVPFLGKGGELCSFFFVLSGFLYNTNNNKEPIAYIKRKCFSIYPMYWICLLLYIVIFSLFGTCQLKFDIIPHIFLLQSYIPSDSDYFFKYLGVSWFLSSLLFCYILSPFLSKLEQKVGPLLIFIVSVVVIISLYLNAKGEYRTWIIYIFPFFRMCEYLMGLSLRSLVSMKKQKRSLFLVDILVLWGYFYALHFELLGNLSSLLHCFMVYYIITYKSRFFNICFGNQYVVYFSKFLIFIYLTHQAIHNALVEVNFHYFSLRVFISIAFGIILGYFYFSIKEWLSKRLVLE